MTKIIKILFLVTTMLSCQETKKKGKVTDSFEESYKEQKDQGMIPENAEHLDSINKIYSNYKYRVAFDAPNDWSSDSGVNDHTIFRTYQRDSSITFMINVIELKLAKPEKTPNIWDFYQENSEKMDYIYKVQIPKQLNTKIKNFEASKSYIKNQISLKRSFSYMVRDLDYEYNNTSIVYQTFLDGHTYTFGLDVPTMFYENNPDYYEGLFLNISFLNSKSN